MGALAVTLVLASVLLALVWRLRRTAAPPPVVVAPPEPKAAAAEPPPADTPAPDKAARDRLAMPPPPPRRRPVVLAPGHSPLDWARLAGGGADLRGRTEGAGLLRISRAQLRAQGGRAGADAWMALGRRVYNVGAYLPFHPGGPAELLRGAGRDGLALFTDAHPWVNYETMLAACLVGVLVEDEPPEPGATESVG